MDKLILSSIEIVPFCLFYRNRQLSWPMKKRTGISIGIAVIIISIIFGIASLPDEVLIKSPSIDTSQNPSSDEKITIPSESISSKEQTESEEETPVEPVTQTPPKEETQGKVIEVKIKDGVGSRDK